jgi:hypothetical protein
MRRCITQFQILSHTGADEYAAFINNPDHLIIDVKDVSGSEGSQETGFEQVVTRIIEYFDKSKTASGEPDLDHILKKRGTHHNQPHPAQML